MFKTVIKEILITILLLIIIALLLGILFYEYIPYNKVIPEKAEEYILAEDVKTEIEQNVDNNYNSFIKTFSVDETKLDYYESTNEYNSGKINPFAKLALEEIDDNENNTTNNTTNNTKSENKNSSTGTFFNTVGK